MKLITYKDLGAGEDPAVDHIETVSLISLLDNVLSWLLLDALHGIQDYAKLLGVQPGEHKSLFESLLERLSDLRRLRVLGSLELLLLVPLSECLCTD